MQLCDREREAEQKRVAVIQELLAACDQADYGKRQRMAAEKLGISVRSVRRLMQALPQARHCRSGAIPQKRLWVISNQCRLARVHSQDLS